MSYKHKIHENAATSGMCTNHRKVPALPGKKRCGQCLAYAKKARRDAISSGVCVACRASKPALGRRKCFSCLNVQRAGNIKRLYGLTVQQVKDMVAAQHGLCAVCQLFKPLNVDHNHETGVVRGMLCGSCNRALGLLKEDPQRISSLLVYIKLWNR